MNFIDELHDSIITTLKNSLPILRTCAEVPEDFNKPPQKRLSLEVPAVLVTATSLDLQASDGTQRLIYKTQWRATCVAGGATTSERLRVARALALQVADIIRYNRFKMNGVEPAQLENLKPLDVDEELKYSAASWVVTWTQQIYIEPQEGES